MDRIDQLNWRKSSFSNPSGNCVDIAFGSYRFAEKPDAEVFIRDSKDADGPVLEYTAAEWQAFLDGVRNNEFELTSVS